MLTSISRFQAQTNPDRNAEDDLLANPLHRFHTTKICFLLSCLLCIIILCSASGPSYQASRRRHGHDSSLNPINFQISTTIGVFYVAFLKIVFSGIPSNSFPHFLLHSHWESHWDSQNSGIPTGIPRFLGFPLGIPENSAVFANILILSFVPWQMPHVPSSGTIIHIYNTKIRSYSHGDVYKRFFLSSV